MRGFADYWKRGIDCYYGGTKTSYHLYIENSKIYVLHPNTVMIGERIGDNFVLQPQTKTRCTDLMNGTLDTEETTTTKYATLADQYQW